MFANNTEYDQTEFYNFASFVYQNDILNEALTVRGKIVINVETLQFTARLKISDKTKA